jgi:hypothetical protein
MQGEADVIYYDRWITDYFVELFIDCEIAEFAPFFVKLAETQLPRQIILERLSVALRNLQ